MRQREVLGVQDYDHYNEEARNIWWEEEGKHHVYDSDDGWYDDEKPWSNR